MRNQNQSESFIANFRWLLFGQIYKLRRKYLDVYAYEHGRCGIGRLLSGQKRLHNSVVSFEDGRPVYRLYEVPVKPYQQGVGIST